VKEVGQGVARRQWQTAQGFRDTALLIESRTARMLPVHFILSTALKTCVNNDSVEDGNKAV